MHIQWWEIYKAQSCDGVHLIIERWDGKPATADWDVLQQIKNDILGEDAYAIEIFPSVANVVNETNRRHLWLVPDDLVQAYDMSRR